MFLRSDGPAETMTAGSPLWRFSRRLALGVATYQPMLRAMFSAVRRLLSTSVFRLVRENDANSESHVCACRWKSPATWRLGEWTIDFTPTEISAACGVSPMNRSDLSGLV